MTKIGRKKPEGERFLRAGAVAALLGVSRRRVSELAAAGRLPTMQFADGANYRFRLQDVMGLVRKRGVDAQAIAEAKDAVCEAAQFWRTHMLDYEGGRLDELADMRDALAEATDALIKAEAEGVAWTTRG